ncbi:hypothetical protein CDD83_9254 [Cordyceps sp. RAO-2017]|nr:hypothetical protein CDD83_9254 [Cordyceps sp. RAO-2017]
MVDAGLGCLPPYAVTVLSVVLVRAHHRGSIRRVGRKLPCLARYATCRQARETLSALFSSRYQGALSCTHAANCWIPTYLPENAISTVTRDVPRPALQPAQQGVSIEQQVLCTSGDLPYRAGRTVLRLAEPLLFLLRLLLYLFTTSSSPPPPPPPPLFHPWLAAGRRQSSRRITSRRKHRHRDGQVASSLGGPPDRGSARNGRLQAADEMAGHQPAHWRDRRKKTALLIAHQPTNRHAAQATNWPLLVGLTYHVLLLCLDVPGRAGKCRDVPGETTSNNKPARGLISSKDPDEQESHSPFSLTSDHFLSDSNLAPRRDRTTRVRRMPRRNLLPLPCHSTSTCPALANHPGQKSRTCQLPSSVWHRPPRSFPGLISLLPALGIERVPALPPSSLFTQARPIRRATTSSAGAIVKPTSIARHSFHPSSQPASQPTDVMAVAVPQRCSSRASTALAPPDMSSLAC